MSVIWRYLDQQFYNYLRTEASRIKPPVLVSMYVYVRTYVYVTLCGRKMAFGEVHHYSFQVIKIPSSLDYQSFCNAYMSLYADILIRYMCVLLNGQISENFFITQERYFHSPWYRWHNKTKQKKNPTKNKQHPVLMKTLVTQ